MLTILDGVAGRHFRGGSARLRVPPSAQSSKCRTFPVSVLLSLLLAIPSVAQALSIDLSFTGSSLLTSNFIPPDTMGAVGPDHFVELLNGRYRVYRNADGVPVQTSTLNDFWRAAGAFLATKSRVT